MLVFLSARLSNIRIDVLVSTALGLKPDIGRIARSEQEDHRGD